VKRPSEPFEIRRDCAGRNTFRRGSSSVFCDRAQGNKRRAHPFQLSGRPQDAVIVEEGAVAC
jgi:hypothetical protein